jgi:VWFA-related protein
MFRGARGGLTTTLTVGIALWTSVRASGQAPPVFATGVDVVAVDVSVVDKDGHPVLGLQAGDFTLSVGGRPRRIVSVEFVNDAGEEAAAMPTPEPTAGKPEATHYSTNENARKGRLILIAVDQGNIPVGTGRGTIAAASRLLDRLSPTDRVGLITIPGPKPRVEFTTDHEAVREAMRSLVGRGRLGNGHISLTEALAIQSGDDPDKSSEAVRRECGRDEGCATRLAIEAGNVVSNYREQSRASLNVLRSLFEVLQGIDGSKSLVLITQGLGEPESGSRAGMGYTSTIRPLAEAAASARVALFAVTVNDGGDLPTAGDNLPLGLKNEDRSFNEYGLETLADVARGVVLRGSPELAFERVARETSGHYLLGFEPEARERNGKNHKLGIKVARAGATVRTWRSVSLPTSAKQQEQALAAALRSLQPATDLPIRVASYALPDAASRKVRVLVVAEIGARPTAGNLSVGYVLVDAKDHVVASAARQEKEAAPNVARIPFAASMLVDPGLYTLKLAARDASGQTGRVDHPVKAVLTAEPSSEVETGDLLFGTLPAAGAAFRPTVVPELPVGAVVVRWDVVARDPAPLEGAEATVEIASTEDSPALGASPARLSAAEAPGHRVVQAVLPLQEIEPGRYVLRATLSFGGHVVSTAHRTILLSPIAGEP